jgi:hypothetical protein
MGSPKKLEKIASFLPNAMGRFKALVTDLDANCIRYDVVKARMILRELIGKQFCFTQRQTAQSVTLQRSYPWIMEG